MAVAYCNFIRFQTAAGGDTAWYGQNYAMNRELRYDGRDWPFLPFAIDPPESASDGEVGGSRFVVALDEIGADVVEQAIREEWWLDVRTVPVDLETDDLGIAMAGQRWKLIDYNASTEDNLITVNLGSGLDLVDAQFPRRVLTRALVGPLPASGNLRLTV